MAEQSESEQPMSEGERVVLRRAMEIVSSIAGRAGEGPADAPRADGGGGPHDRGGADNGSPYLRAATIAATSSRRHGRSSASPGTSE